MNGEGLLIQALVYLAAGVVSVPIAKRLGLGSVLGYLIAGAVVGPFALNLVGQTADVSRFAEFGVVILLFLIGLEVRPALLWRMRTAIFGLGGAQLLATALILALGGLAAGLPEPAALAAGLVLAMSSTAIVLANLEEKGLRRSPTGEAVFGVLLFQDLAVIPLFALLPLLATLPHDGAAAADHAGLLAALPVWARPLAVLAAVAAVAVGGRYLTMPIFRFIAAARLREIFTAFALLLVVSVAALMQMVGLSPALGAFLAGVVLADSEFRRELETDIEPFRGLLLGLFFITVGAGLDFAVIARQPMVLLGLVLGLMALKALAMYAVARLFKMSAREAGTASVSLAQGGEFAFVLLSFTVGAGVLTPDLAKLLSAVVAVSMALTPVAFAVYERLVLARNPQDDAKTPEDLPFEDGDPEVIVAGFGRFGQVAARLLLANDFRVVMLDSSIEQIELLRRFGRQVHYGDAGRIDLLRTAGADKARLLIVAIDDQDKAVELVEAAREAFPNLKILARAWDRRHAYDLLKKGANGVERETFESALKLGERALKGLGFPARRAAKAAGLFRKHDLAAFERLAPVWGEDRYILASRDAAETMERLLRADLEQMRFDEDEEEAEAAAKLLAETPPAQAAAPKSKPAKPRVES